MRTYACPRCKARLRREAGPPNGEPLCPECAYQAAGNRKTAELACQLGEHYSDQGQDDKAIAAYTEAIQLGHNHASAYAGRAKVYFAKKDYPRAINQYTEALRRGLADAKVYLNRGKCHFEQNDYENAEADFTAALRLAPDSVWAYRSRGYLFLLKGDRDKAVGDLTEAIRLDPQFALTYSLRGMVHYDKGEYDRAITDFTRAIEHRLRDVKVYFLLGKSHSHRRNFDKAIAAFTEALRLDPRHAEAYVSRGEAYWLRHKLDQAVADYAQAIRINPTMAEVYSSRALLHLALRHFDAALADLGVASKLDPQSAEVRRRIEIVLDAKDPSRKAAQAQQQKTSPPAPAMNQRNGALAAQQTLPGTSPTPSSPVSTTPNRVAPVASREPGYFYRRKKTVYGPHSFQELTELASSSLMLPTDDVQKEGSPDWKRASAWKEFKFPAAPAPAQPPSPQSALPCLPQIPAYEPAPQLDADDIWDARVRESTQGRKHFYRRKRCCYGPYSSPELRELAVAGMLRPDDELQKDGGDWRRAGDYKKLFAGIDTRQHSPATATVPAQSSPPPAAPPAVPTSQPVATPPAAPVPSVPLPAAHSNPVPPPLPDDDDSIALPPGFLSALTGPPPLPGSPPPLLEDVDSIDLLPGLLSTQTGPPPLPESDASKARPPGYSSASQGPTPPPLPPGAGPALPPWIKQTPPKKS